MTKDQINIIVARYKDDVSFSKIADEVQMSVNTVKHWVRMNRNDFGLERRRNKAEKCGVLSYAVEQDCTWDITRSRVWLTKRWAA
jgi:hypothetical protein